VSLHRLLGFGAAVPDPSTLSAYYAELGLSGDASSGFTGSDGGASVTLAEGPFRRLDSVSVGCKDESDLAAIAGRVEAGGAAATIADGVLSVVDPATRVRFEVRVADATPEQKAPNLVVPNAPGAAVRPDRRAPTVLEGPRPPRRLGHLVIGTPDLAGTVSLLVDGLGFKVSDSLDGVIAFLRCSTDHHNVGVVESPVPQLQHYSWECDDVDHVGHTATALYRVDPERQVWGMGRHFAGSNFYWYLRDPSGSFIELYSDLDQILDDEAWEAEGRTEFDFEHVANSWGPNLPVEFIVPDDLDTLRTGWEYWPP
jgi:catechol 2,3-dioxygenase-like lactoylglutathione lyase family enzyme